MDEHSGAVWLVAFSPNRSILVTDAGLYGFWDNRSWIKEVADYMVRV